MPPKRRNIATADIEEASGPRKRSRSTRGQELDETKKDGPRCTKCEGRPFTLGHRCPWRLGKKEKVAAAAEQKKHADATERAIEASARQRKEALHARTHKRGRPRTEEQLDTDEQPTLSQTETTPGIIDESVVQDQPAELECADRLMDVEDELPTDVDKIECKDGSDPGLDNDGTEVDEREVQAKVPSLDGEDRTVAEEDALSFGGEHQQDQQDQGQENSKIKRPSDAVAGEQEKTSGEELATGGGKAMVAGELRKGGEGSDKDFDEEEDDEEEDDEEESNSGGRRHHKTTTSADSEKAQAARVAKKEKKKAKRRIVNHLATWPYDKQWSTIPGSWREDERQKRWSIKQAGKNLNKKFGSIAAAADRFSERIPSWVFVAALRKEGDQCLMRVYWNDEVDEVEKKDPGTLGKVVKLLYDSWAPHREDAYHATQEQLRHCQEKVEEASRQSAKAQIEKAKMAVELESAREDAKSLKDRIQELEAQVKASVTNV